MKKKLHKRCVKALDRILGEEYAADFIEPVTIEGYDKVIKKPMCLSKIKRKLGKTGPKSKYENPGDFAKDMRLTFRNALKYNIAQKGKTDVLTVYHCATVLLKEFDDSWDSSSDESSSDSGSSSDSSSDSEDQSKAVSKPKAAHKKPKKIKTTSSKSAASANSKGSSGPPAAKTKPKFTVVKCKSVLRSIIAEPGAEPFNDPQASWKDDTYKLIIPNPVCLRQIEKRLQNYEIQSLEEYLHEVRSTFTNNLRYFFSPVTHSDIRDKAVQLLDLFHERLFKKLEKFKNRRDKAPHLTLGEVQRCRKLIDSILSIETCFFFVRPPDKYGVKLPDYAKYVKERMDLGEVQARLNSDFYGSVAEVVYDANLTFSNAVNYHEARADGDAQVLEAARQFQQMVLRAFPDTVPMRPAKAPKAKSAKSVKKQSSAPAARASGKQPPPPTGKKSPAAPKKQAATTAKKPTTPNPSAHKAPNDAWQPKCKAIVEKLLHHQNVAPLSAPVDWKQLGLDDYLEVVKRPMDLGTVHKKLKGGKYASASEFATDVRLVFSNCLLYNKGEHPSFPIRTWCKSISAQFERLWGTNFPSLKAAETAPKVETAPVKQEPGAATPAPKPKPASTSGKGKREAAPSSRKFPLHKDCVSLLRKLSHLKDASIFLHAVNWKADGLLEYPKIVKNPMDLGTIKTKLTKKHAYSSHQEFAADVRLVFSNCLLFNLDETAEFPIRTMCNRVSGVFEDGYGKILAKDASSATNPPPDVQMDAPAGDSGGKFVERKVCEEILASLKALPASMPFRAPVDWKSLGLLDYPTIVTQPMDFKTISKKLRNREYRSAVEFRDDVHLVFSNCSKYNKVEDPHYPLLSWSRELKAKFDQDFEDKVVNGTGFKSPASARPSTKSPVATVSSLPVPPPPPSAPVSATPPVTKPAAAPPMPATTAPPTPVKVETATAEAVTPPPPAAPLAVDTTAATPPPPAAPPAVDTTAATLPKPPPQQPAAPPLPTPTSPPPPTVSSNIGKEANVPATTTTIVLGGGASQLAGTVKVEDAAKPPPIKVKIKLGETPSADKAKAAKKRKREDAPVAMKPFEPPARPAGVEFSNFEIACEDTLLKMCKVSSICQYFGKPVLEMFPDPAFKLSYTTVVENPMDLQTIFAKLHGQKYKSASEFASDVFLIFDNAEKFNQGDDMHTKRMRKLTVHFREFFEDLFAEREGGDKVERNTKRKQRDELMAKVLIDRPKANKCLKVLTAKNRVAINHFFLYPVEWERHGLLDYPTIVKNPMDLGTIRETLSFYGTMGEFATDVRLVFSNCLLYNKDVPLNKVVRDAAMAMGTLFEDTWAMVTCSAKESHLRKKIDDESTSSNKVTSTKTKSSAAKKWEDEMEERKRRIREEENEMYLQRALQQYDKTYGSASAPTRETSEERRRRKEKDRIQREKRKLEMELRQQAYFKDIRQAKDLAVIRSKMYEKATELKRMQMARSHQRELEARRLRQQADNQASEKSRCMITNIQPVKVVPDGSARRSKLLRKRKRHKMKLNLLPEDQVDELDMDREDKVDEWNMLAGEMKRKKLPAPTNGVGQEEAENGTANEVALHRRVTVAGAMPTDGASGGRVPAKVWVSAKQITVADRELFLVDIAVAQSEAGELNTNAVEWGVENGGQFALVRPWHVESQPDGSVDVAVVCSKNVKHDDRLCLQRAVQRAMRSGNMGKAGVTLDPELVRDVANPIDLAELRNLQLALLERHPERTLLPSDWAALSEPQIEQMIVNDWSYNAGAGMFVSRNFESRSAGQTVSCFSCLSVGTVPTVQVGNTTLLNFDRHVVPLRQSLSFFNYY